jgi:hypothetical protein
MQRQVNMHTDSGPFRTYDSIYCNEEQSPNKGSGECDKPNTPGEKVADFLCIMRGQRRRWLDGLCYVVRCGTEMLFIGGAFSRHSKDSLTGPASCDCSLSTDSGGDLAEVVGLAGQLLHTGRDGPGGGREGRWISAQYASNEATWYVVVSYV